MSTSDLELSAVQRLSVPQRRSRPPRPLTGDELAVLLRVADCLIPAAGPNPEASAARDYVSYLQLALAARADVFDRILAAVGKLAGVADDDLWQTLKELWATDASTFEPLSSVVAGAYFMTPQVKELIGYPGQHRSPAPVSQAADELGAGILDPVLERGSIYVSAAGE